ncbi:MAG: hypothetical protein U0X20_11185 [Caldilineaceae bacterium]
MTSTGTGAGPGIGSESGSETRSDIQKRAQSAVLQYAFFRWESALVIALTIVLFFLLPRPFPWWPRYGWLVLGLCGLAALVYSSLTDAETNAKVLLRLFQEQFDTKRIRDKELRADLETALEYQRRIEVQVRQQDRTLLRDRLNETANQITQWIANMYALALRLDSYRRDDLLAKQRGTLPQELKDLGEQRKRTTNPATQAQLDQVIDTKGKQWQALRALDDRMKQAELQLQESLAALATIYSQVQLVDAQSVESGRAERLQSDIRDQVNRLGDLVDSINEVYDYKAL